MSLHQLSKPVNIFIFTTSQGKNFQKAMLPFLCFKFASHSSIVRFFLTLPLFSKLYRFQLDAFLAFLEKVIIYFLYLTAPKHFDHYFYLILLYLFYREVIRTAYNFPGTTTLLIFLRFLQLQSCLTMHFADVFNKLFTLLNFTLETPISLFFVHILKSL